MPVISGRRIVLTYNLAITQESTQEIPTSVSTAADALKPLLVAWEKQLGKPSALSPYFLYKLCHQYTKDNLRLQTLKGSDHRLVVSMHGAAQNTGVKLYLANMERVIVRDDEDRHWGGTREVYEDEITLTNIVDLTGGSAGGSMIIDKTRILQGTDYEDLDPDDEEHSGYTGNEGQTATLWYRDTVCVIRSIIKSLLRSI